MYRKADRGWLKHWDFTLIDAICLQAAYVAAYWLRHGFGWPYVNQLYCNTVSYTHLLFTADGAEPGGDPDRGGLGKAGGGQPGSRVGIKGKKCSGIYSAAGGAVPDECTV